MPLCGPIRRRLGTPLATALAALGLATLCGCQRTPVLRLCDFTLTVEGRPGAVAVRLPGEIGPLLPPPPAWYRLRTEVDLPPGFRGRPLTLAMANMPVLARLVVNGQEVPGLDDNLWDRVRHGGPQRWRFVPALTDTAHLTLEMRIERGERLLGSFDTAPRLSPTELGDPVSVGLAMLSRGSAAAALSTGLFVGFVNLLLFLLDRRRTSHGWFALGAFACSFYPIYLLGLSQVVFGRYDSPALVFSLWLSLVAFVHFVHAQFRLPPPARAWLVAVGAMLIVLLVRPYFRYSPQATVAFTCLTVAYQLWKLAPLTRQKPRPLNVWTLIICWAVIGVTCWPDFLGWTGHGFALGGLRAGCLGLTVFLVLQSASLGRAYSQSLGRADELNVELAHRIAMLEKRQREVQILNEELRRQVRDRSRQLSLALKRVQTGPRRAPPLSPGDVVDDRYRVISLLGSGGMGAVYEVERQSDGRRLALKALKAKAAAPQVARFAREAEISAQIEHPNVVSIVDIDVAESGELFLVMELVRGPTLEQEQARYGELDWALPILRQVALGMDAIHQKGVVHRDLKPSNVLLTPGQRPIAKIADFGIASLRPVLATPEDELPEVDGPTGELEPEIRAAGPLSSTAPEREVRLTRTGVVMGTPPYMAPELVQGAKIATWRSDIYSFGLIAYEILAGAYPSFEPVGEGAGLRALPLGRVAPHVAAELAGLVDRCLDPDPEGRPSAGEILARVGERTALRASS